MLYAKTKTNVSFAVCASGWSCHCLRWRVGVALLSNTPPLCKRSFALGTPKPYDVYGSAHLNVHNRNEVSKKAGKHSGDVHGYSEAFIWSLYHVVVRGVEKVRDAGLVRSKLQLCVAKCWVSCRKQKNNVFMRITKTERAKEERCHKVTEQP